MGTIFILIAIFSLVAFVVGMFSPKTVLPQKWGQTRGKVALIYISAFFLSAIIGSAIDPVETEETTSPSASTQAASDGESTTTTETSAEQSIPNKPQSEDISSVGKAIEIGHFVYTINSFRFKKTLGNEFFGETADGIYLLVDVTIKNISDETRTLDGSSFIVTDTNGIQYDYSTDGSTAFELSGGKTLFLKQCQPNITTKGTLIFEVPAKGDYYIHLVGSLWGSRTVRVPLK